MADDQQPYVVLTDADGAYYLVPQATLAACRVPAERQAAVEDLPDPGDLAGFIDTTNERPAPLLTASAPLLSGLQAGGIIVR